MIPPPPRSTLFPYTTLFRSEVSRKYGVLRDANPFAGASERAIFVVGKNGAIEFSKAYSIDRKSTRLNSSHVSISYAVFCLKKKKKKKYQMCHSIISVTHVKH